MKRVLKSYCGLIIRTINMNLRQGSEKNDGFHRVRILFSREIRFSDYYSTKKKCV